MARPSLIPRPNNTLSLLGSVVAAVSAVLFLIMFSADLMGLHTNPYMGLVFFLLLPGVFIFGLLLIPIGVWRERRRRKDRPAGSHWPTIDLSNPRHRAVSLTIAGLTLVNIVIVSLAAYSGVEYMDSTSFCGQVCHGVMAPEFAAFQDSPHSRLECVQCHIGAGASWFAKSKVSGVRQVFAVALNTYSRPIASPVRNLRPARETCEQCHWPEKFHGDKIKVIHAYADDEKNTDSTTTLQIHVGGGSDRLGMATGIHWHMNVANQIEYIATDDKRQVIPYVWLKDRFGNVREYTAEGVTPDQLAKGERRRLDCVDCHNRPSHAFAPTADRAVDGALAMGEMPATLPYVKREATAALTVTYASQTAAEDAIAARLREFYRVQYSQVFMARRQDVERAVQATQHLYSRNVFPAMNITWGTYPNNLGHMDFPGCFRCHDENHKTKDGKTIGQSCDLCHAIQ
jgi:hypothetical protein